jgi:F-type H+-transporting ATPase subunit b
MHPFHLLLEYVILIPTVHAADSAATSSSGISGVVTMLGINWKLLIAQLINFAIVLFVLWKWVFTPLSEKLAERTTRIEKSLKEADDINKMHRDAEIEKAEAIREARKEASGIIAASEASANKVKEDIIAEAKARSQKILDQGAADLESRQEAMMLSVRVEAAVLIVAATEKIIGAKLDAKADKELIEKSLAGLKEKA